MHASRSYQRIRLIGAMYKSTPGTFVRVFIIVRGVPGYHLEDKRGVARL